MATDTDSKALIDVDHLMCAAPDQRMTRARLIDLGFTSTPFSEAPSMGGGNQLVLFHAKTPGLANYLEFVTTLDAEKIPPPLRPLFAGPSGGLSIVHGVADAAVYVARAAALGLMSLPPMPVSRAWTLESGEVLDVRFTVGIPLPGQSPIMFNACRHDTLWQFQRHSWTWHPNAIVRLARILIASAAPERDSELLAAMHGIAPRAGRYARIALHGPETVVEVLDAVEAARLGAALGPLGEPRLFGVELETASMAVTRARFDAAGCALSGSKGAFFTKPEESCGLVMAIAPAD